jgi:hypothetical protein
MLAERIGVPLGKRLVTVKHTLSHRDVAAVVYRARVAPRWRQRDSRRATDVPLEAPLSALAKKAIAAVLDARGGAP